MIAQDEATRCTCQIRRPDYLATLRGETVVCLTCCGSFGHRGYEIGWVDMGDAPWLPHVTNELPWWRAAYSREANAWQDRQLWGMPYYLPWPEDSRLAHVEEIWEHWSSVYWPAYQAIEASGAARVVCSTGLYGLSYAEALLAAARGDVDALWRPFHLPDVKPLAGGYHGPDHLLSFKERKLAGDALTRELPGALWEAITVKSGDVDVLNLPLYAAYEHIRGHAADIVRRSIFGPRGQGVHGKVKVLPLDAVPEPVADGWPGQWPESDGERLVPLLRDLTPAERTAVLAQYQAIASDESLQEWCTRRGRNYGALQRAWSRAKERLAQDAGPSTAPGF